MNNLSNLKPRLAAVEKQKNELINTIVKPSQKAENSARQQLVNYQSHHTFGSSPLLLLNKNKISIKVLHTNVDLVCKFPTIKKALVDPQLLRKYIKLVDGDDFNEFIKQKNTYHHKLFG